MPLQTLNFTLKQTLKLRELHLCWRRDCERSRRGRTRPHCACPRGACSRAVHAQGCHPRRVCAEAALGAEERNTHTLLMLASEARSFLDGKDSQKMNTPFMTAASPALCVDSRQGSIPLAQKGMFLFYFYTNGQNGVSGHPDHHNRTWLGPPWTAALLQGGPAFSGECAAGRRTGTDQQLRDRREETQSYEGTRLHPGRNTSQCQRTQRRSHAELSRRWRVPWPRGCRRSGEWKASAHTLT